MKISRISPIENSIKIYKNNQKPQILSSIPCDSVSFGSFIPTDKEMSAINLGAKDALKDASVVKLLATGEAKISGAYFDKGQKLYDTCVSYIEKIKQNPHFGTIFLENGHVLDFKFVLDSDDLILDMTEFNKEKIPFRKIKARNFEPIDVMESNYISSNTVEFKSRDSFTYQQGISVLPTTFGKTNKIYVFRNGNINKIFSNRDSASDPQIYDFIFTYENNQIKSCFEEPAFERDGEMFCSAFYTFSDGKLKKVCNDFSSIEGSNSSWKDSYHFDNDILIGYLENVVQEDNSPCMDYEEGVVRLKSGNYMNRHQGFVIIGENGF